jgi:hypothetical protein
MPDRPPVYAVAVLPPGGQGTFATFDTEQSAVDYADRSLPAHPGSRAWILLLEGRRGQRLGVRGAGQWTPDRIPRFYVVPLAGGPLTPFHTYEEARAHASLGMAILSLSEDGGIWVDEV